MNITINYTIEEIAGITGGRIIQRLNALQPGYLLLDSRKLIFPEATIFFALSTSHRKGEQFIKDLYDKGVKNFLVAGEINFPEFPGANFILVDDTLKAIQLLAIHHRHRFNIPVIGITGSNGKTIVKEWLNQLLQNNFNIVRSPKSYNSQIGGPLSVLQMDSHHTLAIFEAGISEPGEMEKLEEIIKPTIGIFTNIGSAHEAGFNSTQQKISEKLKLFKDSQQLIYCSDYIELHNAVKEFAKQNSGLQLFTWSKTAGTSLKIISIEKNDSSQITAVYQGKNISVTVPFTDDASVENAVNCWCVLLQMNIREEIIAERMHQLFPVEMRLELKDGINNSSVINDSYSADINSLSIALDFLQQQKQHPKRTVILSDILQTGKNKEELYHEVAGILKQKNVDRLIGIGEQISSQSGRFSFLKEKDFFVSVDDFKKAFYSLHFNNESILLKGARIFEFENISRLLEQKIHQTILSINLNAVTHNLKAYRQMLKPSTKIMAMVKAFSYGSGSYEIANHLQFNKADYLAVAYTDEGIELRKGGISLPIMVMNPEENTFSALAKYDLEPEVFSFSILHALEKYLQSSAIDNFPVHIKLDTGMHRLGFESHEIKMLADHLKNNTRIKVRSVFSHLAASEDVEEDKFTRHQAEVFLQCCNELEQRIGYSFIRHIANTSGISRHHQMEMDMVRLGIGLYGIDHNPSMQSRLKTVTTLSTTVAQVKNVKKGEAVGYGRKAKLTRDSVIATVRIGYADGYPRSLGNGVGKMMLQNQLVPVVGNVCMDMTMLDVTGMDLEEGDEVIVFGETLPIQTLAEWGKTIPYEIMTGISQRVKRVYFEE